MVERRDVEFGVDGGDRLRGCLFLPSKRAGPPPISVAHGYAGGKEHGLELLVLGATDRRIRAVVSQVPTSSTLFAARRSDLPSWIINKEIFENELPFAVLKRPTTVRALNLTVGRRRISFDTNQLVLRIAVWTFE